MDMFILVMNFVLLIGWSIATHAWYGEYRVRNSRKAQFWTTISLIGAISSAISFVVQYRAMF